LCRGRGLGGETLQSKLAKIQGVTRADLSRVMHKYLAHVFDPKRANVSIGMYAATHSGKMGCMGSKKWFFLYSDIAGQG
jgi:hypothetical protein